jgi:MoxR-like ATPase
VVGEFGSSSNTQVEWFALRYSELARNVESFFRGKPEVVRAALVCVLAEGHLLIDDVPGVGKTSLAKAISQSIDGAMQRIQFTPDLLPTDVTGTLIYDPGQREFVFHPGAVFANIVLGDEINRASPKTQSALLESMEERQVTVDTVTHPLGTPFMVIATQNPIEHEGTYPLPEAQLDRFMLRLSIGYPSPEIEAEILGTHGIGAPLDEIGSVTDAPGVADMIEQTRQVHAAPALRRYIVDLVEATRRHSDIYLGASPRASIALLRAARAMAAADERDFVIPDDVKTLTVPVLAHRVIATADAVMSGRSPGAILTELLDEIPVPVAGND